MLLWIDACDRSCGSELWIGARDIGIEMIGARELWIGIDREGELIQRERESYNRKNEKE